MSRSQESKSKRGLRSRWLIGLLCLVSGAAVAAEQPTFKQRMAAQAEQLALQALPTNKLHQAMGFFGPVTKKYMPVFQQFNSEYLAAKEKMPVIVKYLPKAEAAVADAQKMKVPAKYEVEKQEYLKMLNACLITLKLSAMTMQ